MSDLSAHLASGVTTVARCWRLTCQDGTAFGFTDHDLDLAFEGGVFRADCALEASALSQAVGMSVDNGEIVGALRDAVLTERDLLAGRFDGAELSHWLVNWRAPSQRRLLFRGHLGEVTSAGGAFRAELRGMMERLNTPVGRVYHRGCSAVLGDGRCQVDLTAPGLRHEMELAEVVAPNRLRLTFGVSLAAGWFARGKLRVMSGRAEGLEVVIKNDRPEAGARWIDLAQDLRILPEVGDLIRLEAGCDHQAACCRDKFDNFINFRGFPHIPTEDWLVAVPRPSGGGA